MKDPCLIDGCDREVKSRGYCESHYRKLRRRGELPPANYVRTRPKSDGMSIHRRVIKGIQCVLVHDEDGRLVTMDLCATPQEAANTESEFREAYLIG